MSDNFISTADVLERAADLLWMRGRAREVGQDSSGRVCPLGALAACRGLEPYEWAHLSDADPAGLALAQHLASSPDLLAGTWAEKFAGRHGVNINLVWAWNDDVEDDELVVDTMRRCAKDERVREGLRRAAG